MMLLPGIWMKRQRQGLLRMSEMVNFKAGAGRGTAYIKCKNDGVK